MRGLSLLLFTVGTLGCVVGCSAVLVFLVAVMCLMVGVVMWRRIVMRAFCEFMIEDGWGFGMVGGDNLLIVLLFKSIKK